MTTPSRIVGLPAVTQSAIVGDITTGITATGSTQATAYALTTDINTVTTTAASTGVILPQGEIGKTVEIYNGGANTLTVYPPVGGAINNGAANAGFSVATTKAARFRYTTGLNSFAILSA